MCYILPMKVVLATPLYPPDIAPPAHYIKELATRLRSTHTIEVLTYGHIPERISGVSIHAISKRKRRAFRLLSYTGSLYTYGKEADVLFVENGLSVELPALLCSFFIKTPIVFHIGDVSANTKSESHVLSHLISKMLKKRSRATITAIPQERPEILPFGELADMGSYENSWKEHLVLLTETLSHAKY